MRKNTPETMALTQTERARQILRLQEAILLEEKARREKVKNHNPNALFEKDRNGKIPF